MRLISDIFEVNQKFKKSFIARITFDGKKMSVSKGRKSILGMLDEDGIVGEDQKVYRPKDGEKFMRALPYQFDGSRFRATLVEKK